MMTFQKDAKFILHDMQYVCEH